MATMTITIPDNKVQDVLDALSTVWGYTGAGSETKAQFVKRTIMEHLKLAYLRGKRETYTIGFVVPADPGIDVT